MAWGMAQKNTCFAIYFNWPVLEYNVYTVQHTPATPLWNISILCRPWLVEKLNENMLLNYIHFEVRISKWNVSENAVPIRWWCVPGNITHDHRPHAFVSMVFNNSSIMMYGRYKMYSFDMENACIGQGCLAAQRLQQWQRPHQRTVAKRARQHDLFIE